jgi:hypothetical protein
MYLIGICSILDVVFFCGCMARKEEIQKDQRMKLT